MGVLKNFFQQLKGKKLQINDLFYEELEGTLIEADIGLVTTQMILDYLKNSFQKEKTHNNEQLKILLKKYLNELITEGDLNNNPGLKIILFTGINGVGKTTSLVKTAYYLKQNNFKVKLVAGDTFRAAAIDQITVWSEKIKLPLIKSTIGSDSGAVVFDSITSALKDNTDYLLIDTSGRMHTNENLMKELKKLKNICLKRIEENNIENILVADATTGQNGFIQAEIFHKFIPVSGIFLSKFDSIFKGGTIIRISSELHIPIKFIGTGESITDFSFFNKKNFIESLGL